jgi:N-acetylneuraminate synthase
LVELQESWTTNAGVSDHTLGTAVAVAATALGACMLEKHLMLEGDRSLDAGFSLTPKDFAAMVRDCREVEAAMGTEYPVPSERALSLGRSLYVFKPIPAATLLTQPLLEDAVRSSRPGKGLPVSKLLDVVGDVTTRNLVPGEPFTEGCYEQGPLVPRYYRAK